MALDNTKLYKYEQASILIILTLALTFFLAILITGCTTSDDKPEYILQQTGDSEEQYNQKTPVVMECERGNTPGNSINGGWVFIKDEIIIVSVLSFSEEGYVWPIFRLDDREAWMTEGLLGNDFLQLDENVSDLNIIGDWIYYINWIDNRSIYRIKSDGSEKMKINNEASYGFSLVDDWIYYGNFDDDNRIYKIRTDGSGRVRLNNHRSRYINVVDGWIYYSSEDEGGAIYKMRTDGTEQVRLNNDASRYINVCSGWIYYINEDASFSINRISLDGTKHSLLSSARAGTLNADKGQVYFSLLDEAGIFSLPGEGGDITLLRDDPLDTIGAHSLNIVNGWLYYQNGEAFTNYHRIRTDGSDYRLLLWADEQQASVQNDIENPEEQAVLSFICSGEVLSSSDVIGAAYPELYYFSPTGSFAYQSGEYGVREQGQLMTKRGNWTFSSGQLFLVVQEEMRAFGGQLIDDLHQGEVYIDYDLVYSDEEYILEYNVTVDVETNGREYMLWDKQPVYRLYVAEYVFSSLQTLADDGYENF